MEDDYQETIDNTLDRINSCDEVDDATKEVLFEFYEALQQHNVESNASNQISGIRMNGYLGDMHRLAKNAGDITATLDPGTGEQTIKSILEWVDSNYNSGSTIDTIHNSLREFGRHMAPDAPDGELPDRFDDISLGNTENEEPAPEPSKVLFWQDIVTLITDGGLNPRTIAMIVFLWASGLRPMSEFWELRFDQIDDRGDHLLVSVRSDSKTLARTLRIDVGAPYIRKWMFEEHPANDTEAGPEPDTYVWTLLDKDVHLDYQDIRRSIKRAARYADITKPCNPEHFRKSRASVLARSRYVTQRDLEYHFGWVPGSWVAAHYIAEFGSHSRKHIAKADGANVSFEEEDEPIVPVVCDSCGEWTPRHRDTCLWCPAEVIASLGDHPQLRGPTVEEEGQDLLDMLVEGELEAEHLRGLKKMEPILKRRDDLFERLDSYIEHAEQLES